MTAVLEAGLAPLSLFATEAGEPTLDDVIAGVWEGLTTRSQTRCPVCDGVMSPDYAAQSLPIGGRCNDCGSTLR